MDTKKGGQRGFPRGPLYGQRRYRRLTDRDFRFSRYEAGGKPLAPFVHFRFLTFLALYFLFIAAAFFLPAFV